MHVKSGVYTIKLWVKCVKHVHEHGSEERGVGHAAGEQPDGKAVSPSLNPVVVPSHEEAAAEAAPHRADGNST